MSRRFKGLVSAAAACLVLGAIPEAGAQGFFQSLFGFGQPEKPVPQPQQQNLPPFPGYGYRAPGIDPFRRRDREPEDTLHNLTGSYRTVCVRTCDGFYFPVSNATTGRNFARDADACRASCGGTARLFYHRAGATDAAAEMVDLQGRPYESLQNAFTYRKTLVAGCACKPDPWAMSELARHRKYAAQEEADRQRSERIASGLDTGLPGSAKTSPGEGIAEPAAVAGPVSASAPLKVSAAHSTTDRLRKATKPADAYRQPQASTRQPARAAAPAGGSGIFGLGGPKSSGPKWPGD